MEQLPYIHQDLTVDQSLTKGRLVTATSAIECGDVLLKDAPYALVPSLLVDEPPFLLCSRHECSRRISLPHHEPKPCQIHVEQCAQRCVPEVVWCGQKCRSQDQHRHGYECMWLKKTSHEIRSSYGDTEFVLMWLIVRILINRHLEDNTTNDAGAARRTRRGSTSLGVNPNLPCAPSSKWLGSHFGRRGWEAVWNLEGDTTFFSPEKVKHWRTMTSNYICNGLLPLKYAVDDIVKVICKMELNSFGLYPGVTGHYPAISDQTRGDYYGGGIYPTAAMFNHSCCPNVTHELDEFGVRIFKAGRGINVGEECCISYFDLAEYPGSTARREAITTSWDFSCDCRRCEQDMDVPDFLKALDFDV